MKYFIGLLLFFFFNSTVFAVPALQDVDKQAQEAAKIGSTDEMATISKPTESKPWEEARKKAEKSNSPEDWYEYAEYLGYIGGGYKEAIPWYEKSASQGNPYAKIAMAEFKFSKIQPGTPEDIELQKKLCPEILSITDKLQSNNSPQDAYNLASLYEGGICVKEDAKKAFDLNLYAAKNNIGPAQLRTARNYREQNNAEQMLYWYEKALANGIPAASYELAEAYFNGDVVEKNPKKAMEYVQKAIDTDSVQAFAAVGHAFLKGSRGFPTDEARGRALLEKAAERGHIPSQKLLQKLKNK